MNTGKQINAMVAVLFVTLIAIGAYTIWDPFRSNDAEATQEHKAAERGATTFALNCRLCHGDRGQGGANGGRLPAAPALNDGHLQGLVKGSFSQGEYDLDYKFVTNTVMCGRVGTFMPTWGQSQGGTLNDEQLRQLAILITKDYFDYAQEHADLLDATTSHRAAVDMPDGSLSADGTDLTVSNASAYSLGEYIRIQDERLRVRPRSVEVERGVDGTIAAKHGRGSAVTIAGAVPSPTPERGAVRPPTPVTGEAVDAKVTAIPVSNTSGFAAGDVLQIDDEHVRVTGIVTGLPSTKEKLAKEIGREPRKMLVTGAEGLEVGQTIRLEGELMEVVAITDDGDTEATIDQDTTASDTFVSFSDPVFFNAGYVIHVGDEQMRVVGPVDTRQTLAETIGRAQTHFAVTGTKGLTTGMTIRLGEEEIRIVEIVSPAHLVVERGTKDADGNETTKADHAADVELLAVQAAAKDEEAPAPKSTGQTLLHQVGAEDTSIDVTGTAGISPGQTLLLGDELASVTDVVPAQVRVERAVNDSKLTEHPRRGPVFEANLLEVERGVNGTPASAHTAGGQVLMTKLQVKRETGGSKVADHAKNTELYLGNRLIVQRGALKTDPAEHANGELVRDFPAPPDSPATNPGPACGQVPRPTEAAAPVATAIPGGQDVAVSLAEFTVTTDKTSIPTGAANITVSNDGTIAHNFRVIATDLPADGLPLTADGLSVDETLVTVVDGFTAGLQPGTTQLVAIPTLAAGNYVLICNVPTHYGQAMRAAFTVTP